MLIESTTGHKKYRRILVPERKTRELPARLDGEANSNENKFFPNLSKQTPAIST